MKRETAEYPKKDPYEYADKVVRALVRVFIRLYAGTNLLPSDELNVLHGVRELYEEVYRIIREAFLRLGRKAYADRAGEKLTSEKVRRRISEKWVEEQFEAFDPVTKTVFKNDLERRRELLFEAIIATGDVPGEMKNALKALTRQIKQEVITVTDSARDAADEDEGIPQVIWLTRQDERRCAVCGKMHGEIFDFDKIPKKPHPNCRCWTVPWPFKGD